MPAPVEQALDFLRWLRPAGSWCLSSIPIEGGLMETVTFGPLGAKNLLDWLRARDEKVNLYYMVNPARSALDKKAKKEDVEALEFLHVDLDPRKPAKELSGEKLSNWVRDERKRILATLEEFKPRPSSVVDSGGGYQAFWRLDAPLHIGGSLVLAADAEAYNQQLGILLGGDNTQNCDRIMRLPGTTNMPDKKKVAKGRTQRVASVVWVDDSVYPLSAFTPAPRVQTSGGSGAKVKISGNLPFLKDLDELPEKVSPRTRMLIVQGDDPDDPTKYASRSDVVWAVACELVRAGCEDDMIAAVLLDPDFGISGHVRDQPRSANYAARQIQRAREHAEDPMLRIMNERHAVIADLGGKCRVISEVLDVSLKRPRSRLSKQSFEDFRNRYMHQKVQVGATKEGVPIHMPAGKWWLQHEMRRQYDTMVFAPGQEVPGAYNLWQGFACEAIPGDGHQLFLQHIRDNICSGVEEHYDYVMCWMARAVQQPGTQGEVAIVLRGGRGTGKGTFCSGFGSLWGRHFFHVSSAKHLVGQFNAHLRDCVVLFADEAFFAGDRQHESTLKTLITEDILVVEGKGVDAEISPNYAHLLMSSNGQWVVPAGADERRFMMLDVSDDSKQNKKYFAAIKAALDAGGREALLHHLMNLDISSFEVRDVPQTAALQDQKMFSMSTEEEWWMERLMDGRTTATSTEWSVNVQKERLQADYLRYAEAQRIWRRLSPTMLGKFLGRVLPNPHPISTQRMTDVEKTSPDGRVEIVRERCYWYELPELQVCREAWEKRYSGGQAFLWPTEQEDEPRVAVNNRDPY